MDCSLPGSSILHYLLELAQIHVESVMPPYYPTLCHPLLLLPSIFPSIRVLSSESALHIRWPKCWRSSFSIRPSNEYSGLISFKIDWLDLLAVQRTLKSLLQNHNSKAKTCISDQKIYCPLGRFYLFSYERKDFSEDVYIFHSVNYINKHSFACLSIASESHCLLCFLMHSCPSSVCCDLSNGVRQKTC